MSFSLDVDDVFTKPWRGAKIDEVARIKARGSCWDT
jgi:hypothetical protein